MGKEVVEEGFAITKGASRLETTREDESWPSVVWRRHLNGGTIMTRFALRGVSHHVLGAGDHGLEALMLRRGLANRGFTPEGISQEVNKFFLSQSNNRGRS